MRHLRTLLTSVALLLAGAAGLYRATDRLQAFTTDAAQRIAVRERPVALPDVELQTQAGASIRLADLRGRWLLVDFVYTRCPTYCTSLGSEFAQLQAQLASPLARHAVGLLSISFDPSHDAPEQLAAYLARSGRHGTTWLAARPVRSDGLAALMRAFGVTVIPDGLGGYTHNTRIGLVDPQGRLVDLLDGGDAARTARAVLARLGR